MQRNDSTSNPRLCSDTVVFRSKTAYKYFRWSKDRRFFGLFQPNQLRLRNIFWAWLTDGWFVRGVRAWVGVALSSSSVYFCFVQLDDLIMMARVAHTPEPKSRFHNRRTTFKYPHICCHINSHSQTN